MLRCLSKNRLYTKMLTINLLSIFTIKSIRTLAGLAPLVLLIVKTLTYVLYLLHKQITELGLVNNVLNKTKQNTDNSLVE